MPRERAKDGFRSQWLNVEACHEKTEDMMVPTVVDGLADREASWCWLERRGELW